MSAAADTATVTVGDTEESFLRLVTSWDELVGYAALWNGLWRETEAFREVDYSLPWLRQVVEASSAFAWSGMRVPNRLPVVSPMCVFMGRGGVVSTVLPLCLRACRRRGGIGFRRATFFPCELFWRYGWYLGTEPTREQMGGVLDLLRWRGVHVVDLPAQPEEQASRVDHAAGSAAVIWARGRASGPGTQPADLLGVRTRGAHADYARSKRNLCSDVRRARNGLTRLGAWRFWRSVRGRVTGTAVPLDVIRSWIEQVSGRSWQDARGSDPVSFWRGDLGPFLRHLAETATEDLAFLFLDNTPVSFCIGSVVHHRTNLHFTAYDARYAGVSPGTVLMYEWVRDTFDTARDIEYVNFAGSKEGGYKHRFATHADSTYRLSLFPGGPLSRLAYWCRRLRSGIEPGPQTRSHEALT